jgi:hypothetical protein
MNTDLPPDVRHDPLAMRFALELEGHLAVLDYQLADGKIVFTHTHVPDELGGRGIGSRLARAGLEHARAQGLRVLPLCSFIAGYIQKHPEYQALVE